MAICPTCGASVAAGDRFCGACGGELPIVPAISAADGGSGRNRAVLWLVVAGGLVLGIGFYQAIQHNFVELPASTPPASPVPELGNGGPVTWRVEGTIVYTRLKSFADQTHSSLVEAIKAVKSSFGRDLQGYVVDLRDIPDGKLDQAISVADEFLDKGAILLSKNGSSGETQRAQATPGDITENKRIVVLVNGATALAANVVAGALQDHRRATIVGTRSRAHPSLKSGASAEYYTPSGRALSLGIDPDVVVEQGRGDKSTGRTQPSSSSSVPENPVEDTQLQYSLDLLRKPR